MNGNGPGKAEERITLEVGERVLEALLAAKIPGLSLRVRRERPEIRLSWKFAKADLELGGFDGEGRLILVPRGAAAFLTRILGGMAEGGGAVTVREGRILVDLLPRDLPVTLTPLVVEAWEGGIRLVSILST